MHIDTNLSTYIHVGVSLYRDKVIVNSLFTSVSDQNICRRQTVFGIKEDFIIMYYIRKLSSWGC